MDPELEEVDFDLLDTKFDNIENLSKKDTFTPFSVENFEFWNQWFMFEVNKIENEKKKKL